MTTIRKIVTSQVDGNSANESNTSEIRPFGEAGFYIDTNGDTNKLVLSMFEGQRTHLRSKVLSPGVFYGSNADSGDGLGYDTIKLIPDAQQHFNSGSYGNDQYIIIDPTIGEPGHIHVRAGGTIDQSTADLFLGGEQNNVRVSDTNDRVTITTDAGEGTHIWTFNNNGDLTTPGNITVTGGLFTTYGTVVDVAVNTDNYVSLHANPNAGVLLRASDSELNYADWKFDIDGTLTFPNGSTYDNNTLTGAVDSDLEFVVKHRTTVSDVAAAGSTTGTLIVDISANDDITVVVDGWEINAGSEIAPIWMSVTETTIDPGVTYEIVVPEFGFETGGTYTFRNPTPTSKVWTIGSQNGTLIAPGNAILSNETAVIDNLYITYDLSSPSRFNKVYWEAADNSLHFGVATDTALPVFVAAMELKAELEAFGVVASRTIRFTTLGGTTHSITFPQYSNIQSQLSITELGSVSGITWLIQEGTWGVNGAPTADTIIDITSLSFSEAGTYRDFAIELPSQNGVAELRWDFNNDGTTVFPGSLEFGDGSVQTTAFTGPGDNIVNGVYTLSVASTGPVNVPTASTGLGRLQNADGIEILTNSGETAKLWTFGASGELTVPGNITKTSGNLEITAENYVIIDSTNGGQIDIGANQSGEGSGDSGTILVGHAGNVLDIAAGKLRINATTPPIHSTGAVGDVAGLVAFSSGYLYYCTADYGQTGHQIVVATLYNGNTSINSNVLQMTKTADTLQITVGDIISDSDGGATSVVGTVSHDANYTYIGTGAGGGVAYNCVFPLTFTSTDYVAGGNIWKRVAWSGDTW